MLQNYDVDIKEFLSLTNAGLKVADFVQVKAAIIKRYKEAYGTDIDLSTASADGIFINDLALIINNILKTISTMYANLDVNSASGVYLDLLCRLSNVKRKLASNSYASLEVKNLNLSGSITLPAKMSFFDKSGTQWTGDNSEIELEAGQSETINVICDEIGAVQAPAGYISQAIDAGLNISVTQSQAAVVGGADETDADLRERRAQSNGAQGVTVLESLYGALRQNSSIEDVRIYNNASDVELIAQDGTVIPAHDIYVILRKKQDVTLNVANIGSLIYEKLTPGISTTPFDEESLNEAFINGLAVEYSYIPVIIGAQVELFQQPVYWKEAVSIAPEISVTIRPEPYFNADLTSSDGDLSNTNNTFRVIADSLMSYLNNLSLGSIPSSFDIQLQTIDADPLFKTKRTYVVTDAVSPEFNRDTFFNYTTYSVEAIGSGYYTITLR